MARKRAVGSNQYQARAGVGFDPAEGAVLMAQAGASTRVRCGDVWGTNCRAWVQAPDFRHGTCGRSFDAQVRAAANPQCLPEVLAVVATSDDPVLRFMVVKHPLLSPAVLNRMAQDPVQWVRVMVAIKTSGRDVLEHLSNDPVQDVRQAVGANHSTDPDILRRMTQDNDSLIRRTIASNQNCPADVLIGLVGDDDQSVCQMALRHPALPEQYRILGQLVQ